MTAPLALLRASMHMLPRLEAEESILAANRVAMGSGAMKPEDAQRVARGWERQAGASLIQPAGSPPRALPHMGLGARPVVSHG